MDEKFARFSQSTKNEMSAESANKLAVELGWDTLKHMQMLNHLYGMNVSDAKVAMHGRFDPIGEEVASLMRPYDDWKYERDPD